MNKTHVKSTWNNSAVLYALRKKYWNYVQREETEPSVLYVSNNMGIVFSTPVCYFAIKTGLSIQFVERNGYEEPFFYFGD